MEKIVIIESESEKSYLKPCNVDNYICLKNGCRKKKTIFENVKSLQSQLRKESQQFFIYFLITYLPCSIYMITLRSKYVMGFFGSMAYVFAKLSGYGSNFLRFCEINSLARLVSSFSKYRKNACLNSCI